MTEQGGKPDSEEMVFTGHPGEPDKYLGNLEVTRKLFNQFARDTVLAYDEFLRGSEGSAKAQGKIDALVHRYADIFMGRSDEYTAAPWQSPYKLGGRLRAMYEIEGNTDPGVGYFTFLAAQCMEAAKAMVVDGMDDAEAGAKLAEIVNDGVERFMYLTR